MSVRRIRPENGAESGPACATAFAARVPRVRVAVLRADGYEPPIAPVIGLTGVLTAVTAPIGAFSHSLVAITAAMTSGTGLGKFRDMFPDRFFDVGICESHAVAFAAGLAKSGLRPIVDIYSTFLQRSYDQIFQEVALQNLPVTLLLEV